MSRPDKSVPYPLGVTQSITTSGTSARTSAGVGAQTRVVLISATEAAFYNFGDATVTASATNGTYIAAGQQHFVLIRSNQRVAAIQATTAGTVFVSEFGY